MARTQIPGWMNRRAPWAGGAAQAAAGLLALATLTACGGAGDGTPPGPEDMAVLPPDLILADLKDSTYPAGPYAQSGSVNLGDVLPDFTFQGYWSPTLTTGVARTQPFGEVTLGMMHDSGARFAILNLSAFW